MPRWKREASEIRKLWANSLSDRLQPLPLALEPKRIPVIQPLGQALIHYLRRSTVKKYSYLADVCGYFLSLRQRSAVASHIHLIGYVIITTSKQLTPASLRKPMERGMPHQLMLPWIESG